MQFGFGLIDWIIMKLKTMSKINVHGKYILKWFSYIVDVFFMSFLLLLITVVFSFVIKFMYKPDSFFNVIGVYANFLLIIDFFVFFFLLIMWCVLDRFFDSLIEKTIPFYISKNKKMIIIYLINKSHNKSTKLHLELKKLEKSINNKSDIYNKFSEDDFPYIHKFIRRFKKSFLQSEKTNVNKEYTQENPINTRNIENLNLPIESPKLPTLDVVDNELNDLIYHQMNVVKKEKVE